MDLRNRKKAIKLESLRLKGRTAFAEDRFGWHLNGRTKLASSEGVEGLETRGKFDRSDTALAKEPAQKIRGRCVTFLRVAFEAAGDEISIRIAA